jgi:PAS domain S-box-containing protein
MRENKDEKGFLVLSRDGEIQFSSGLGANASVAAAVRRRWLARRDDRKLLTLEAGGRNLLAVAACNDDAAAFVLFAAGSGDILFEFAAEIDFAEDILRQMLTSPYESLAVVDREGQLQFLSPLHERALGLRPGEAVGRHVTQVIENTRLHEVARTGKAEVGAEHIQGERTHFVLRVPVLNDDGRVVGALGHVMFKGREQLQSMFAEVLRLRSENSSYLREISMLRTTRRGLDQMIGRSRAITLLKEQIARVAPLNVPVLLVGESGTGKELAAQAIHQMSGRCEEAMITVNAAAMPATLVESELFGYEPGSFTGAERKGKKGKFEQADRGTLFFDEVGDMPSEIQVKLLRVLQDGGFERVGGEKPRHSDFRLVCATHRNFTSMIESGEFRLDLFYRISGVVLKLPSLRERVDDIELLADQALAGFSIRHSTKIKRLGPNVLDFLCAQHWPGNVRQLMHAVERAAIFCDDDYLSVGDFHEEHEHMTESNLSASVAQDVDVDVSGLPVQPRFQVSSSPELPQSASTSGLSVREAKGQVEDDLIRTAMERHKGNKLRVAAELGISRSYLYKKLAELSPDSTRRIFGNAIRTA